MSAGIKPCRKLMDTYAYTCASEAPIVRFVLAIGFVSFARDLCAFFRTNGFVSLLAIGGAGVHAFVRREIEARDGGVCAVCKVRALCVPYCRCTSIATGTTHG